MQTLMPYRNACRLSLLALALLGMGVPPMAAVAKTATATNGNLPMYFGGTLPTVGIHGGYQLSLDDLNVQVTYEATITNLTTGTQVTDGSQIAVGTPLRLAFRSHQTSDVYWFGTGGLTDSPYGEWRANAAAAPSVSCEADDKVNNTPLSYQDSSTPTMKYNQYANLVVHPPVETITNTAGLTCSAATTAADGTVSQDCTVSSAGTIEPRFNAEGTYGRFYPRYDVVDTGGGYWPDNGCVTGRSGNADTAMMASCGILSTPSCSQFQLDPMIPPKTIAFSFTAIDPNDPPGNPTVGGPSTGTTCPASPSAFTLVATDPDGDQIRYGVDWDGNSVVDQWVPATGYAASGVQQSVSRSWTSAGTYSFKVLVQDTGGASSGWTTKSITISTCPAAPAALLTANPTQVGVGQSSTLTWSCSGNATSASITPGFPSLSPSDGNWAGTPNGGTVSTGNLSANQTYTLSCVGPGGTGSEPETVTVTDDLPDLRAGDVAPTTSIAAGTMRTWSADIWNEGVVGSTGSFTTLLQKANTASGAGAVDADTGTVSTSLAANQTVQTQFSYQFPVSDGGTTRYLRACADKSSSSDADGVIDEEEEGDNCGDWVPVAVTCPSGSPCEGEALSCSYDDANHNGIISLNESVTFSASPSDLGNGDYLWDASNASAVEGNASYTRSFASEGEYSMDVTAPDDGFTEAGTCEFIVGETACSAANVSIEATPDRVKSGTTTVLEWTIPSTPDDQCVVKSSADASWSIPIDITACTPSGSTSGPTHAIESQTTFTLTCTNKTDTVVVNVFPKVDEF